jgi:hypothetical protein
MPVSRSQIERCTTALLLAPTDAAAAAYASGIWYDYWCSYWRFFLILLLLLSNCANCALHLNINGDPIISTAGWLLLVLLLVYDTGDRRRGAAAPGAPHYYDYD